MLDYLVIGQGVAGSCFALKLLREGKSFLVLDEDRNRASSVAVGIYNPIVLKRFSLIWNATDQLELMHDYFTLFENILHEKFIEEIPTYRILKNEDEVKTWKKKASMESLQAFLSDEIHTLQNPDIHAPFGFAEVKQTGRIDLGKCLSLFKEYLVENQFYQHSPFDYNQLEIHESGISYQVISAKRIVFCEGFGVLKNPYFNYLPVIGVKGEVLKVETETELPKAIWKAHNFLLPENGKSCLTASTYDRDDLSYEPTLKGREEIQQHLEEIYTGNYTISGHTAGIRPTVIDRRPILGNHPDHPHLFILNGMGTRGTLLAPQMTEFLYDYIETGKEIDKEASIRRFDKLWK